MSEKNQIFAFVSGEVAPEFYGRRDLAKFPLALRECENFWIDFRGGLINRTGTEFIAMLPRQPHIWATFSTRQYDLALLFLAGKMLVLRDGKFVPSGSPVVGTADAGGIVSETNTFADGDLVHVTHATREGYYLVGSASGSSFRLEDAAGFPVEGPVSVTPTYALTTPYAANDLESLRFFQEGPDLIVTTQSHVPTTITYTADDDWALAAIASNQPDAPGTVTLTPSTSGSASVSYVVTAVVNGVESEGSSETRNNVVNMSATTGHITVSWVAAPEADEYYIYRSLVYPTATYPAGADYGYIGKTTGTSFVDGNITPDFTKSPPEYLTFWGPGNYPTTYCRFQQRGYFAGMENDPLSIVASVPGSRNIYLANTPPIATDALRYELDSQTGKPIHSLLPLRYGLLIFDAQGITQLKGSGQSVAISATDAFAEVQGYTSVAPIQPIAINLDVIYTTELFTEVNAMVYTEYTNSFKTQDISILSSHLFGEGRGIKKMTWLPEPHKLVTFIREDGQLISLTYESTQDVYAWGRQRTRGEYLNHTMLRENKHCVLYQSNLRELLGAEVMTIERERPRRNGGYDRHWFVDCGGELPLVYPASNARAVCQGEGELADWHFFVEGGHSAIPLDAVVYVKGAMFRVSEDAGTHLVLRPKHTPEIRPLYDLGVLKAGEGDWGYASPTNNITGLWWLEGQNVSVQVDGDYWLDKPVVGGEVTFDGEGARILAGLPYECRAQTLALGLPDMMLDGRPLALRGVALRQWQTRGLAIGPSYDEVEELPSRSDEPWGNPLRREENLVVVPMLGQSGWQTEQHLAFIQRYPSPTNVLGLVFNLDVGDD